MPGGHYDIGDNIPQNTALREAMEETGLQDLEINQWHQENQIPFDIIINQIPPSIKKNEGTHVHYDFSYIINTPPNQEIKLDTNESDEYRWVPINSSDPTLLADRMISKIVNKLHILTKAKE